MNPLLTAGEWTVDDAFIGERLDVALAKAQPQMSRAQWQKHISAGAVRIGEEAVAAKYKLRAGDRIQWNLPPPEPSPLTPTPMHLDILYEDDALVVVNKPAGLVVHPGAGTGSQPTLVSGLLFHSTQLPETEGDEDPDAALRPGIVHRLDKDTTGALVVAKTTEAHRHLADQFAKKTNLRQYVALLDGAMKQTEITRESYLARDPKARTKFRSLDEIPGDDRATGGQSDAHEGAVETRRGRFARSHFYRQEVYGNRITLAHVRLETGRTHQIRVHARDIKLPIIGDLIYHHKVSLLAPFDGKVRATIAGLERQMLHAEVLGFAHPTSGKYMEFTAPWPDDLKAAIELLRAYRTL